MTFSSLEDVIKLVVFYSIFTKMTTLKSVLCKEKVITDKIQWYPDSRVSQWIEDFKNVSNFFIGSSFIKIIAVQFGAI